MNEFFYDFISSYSGKRHQSSVGRGRSFGMTDMDEDEDEDVFGDDVRGGGHHASADGCSEGVSFCETSFRCLHLQNPVRKICIRIVSNP